MFAAAGISSISRLSAKSSSHSREDPASCFLLLHCASFLVLPCYFVNLSCGGDVEEEIVLELDDSPGTTKGNVVLNIAEDFLPMLVRCGF